jgi:phosphotransferase system enzyme I (PtsI)
MTPPLLPSVKYLVRSMKFSDAKRLATEALASTDAKKTYAMVDTFYRERVQAGG